MVKRRSRYFFSLGGEDEVELLLTVSVCNILHSRLVVESGPNQSGRECRYCVSKLFPNFRVFNLKRGQQNFKIFSVEVIEKWQEMFLLMVEVDGSKNKLNCI